MTNGNSEAPLPVHLQVANLLRNEISSRLRQPGERLIEREICEATGFSRPAVREALRVLESEGLVMSSLSRGTRVATLTWLEARDIYEVRGQLESLAARLFTERATTEEKRMLRKAVRAIERAKDDSGAILDAKEMFYRVLLDGAGNDVLTSTLASLNLRVRYLRASSLSVRGRPAQSLSEIKVLLEAIEGGDAEAASAACLIHVSNAAEAAWKGLQSARPV